MKGVTAYNIVFDLGGLDKGGVVCRSEKRIRKISEEVLQKGRDRGNVLVEGSRIPEINLARICEKLETYCECNFCIVMLTVVKHCFHLHDMWSGSGSAIDSLHIKAK